MNDLQGPPDPGPPQINLNRLIALTGIVLGAMVALTGMVMTGLCAYLLWHTIQSSTGTDAGAREDMISYFDSINHQMESAVGVTVGGLLVVVASVAMLPPRKE